MSLKRKILVLRITQIVLAILMTFEVFTSFRMLYLNSELSMNEKFRTTQASEEHYEKTYYSLQSEKADLRSNNWYASMPILGRFFVMIITMGILLLVVRQKNYNLNLLKRKLRRQKLYNQFN